MLLGLPQEAGGVPESVFMIPMYDVCMGLSVAEL